MLFAFLIIFSLEMLVIVRITEAFDVWRVARVSSIIQWDNTVEERNTVDLSDKSDTKSYFGVKLKHIKFGDAVADSLEGAFNVSFEENPYASHQQEEQKGPVYVIMHYSSEVFNKYFKLNKEVFYWNCPGPPKGVKEHQESVIETGGG